MKSFLRAAAVLALSLGAHSQTLADDLATPRYGAWGVDLAARDTGVRPGDDFFRYAQGAAVDRMVVPPDRSRYGAFDVVGELSDARTHTVLEAAVANRAATGSEAKVGAFYRAFMDEERVEQLDAGPLQPGLARIRAAATREAIAAIMGDANAGFDGTFIGSYAAIDARNTRRYAVHLTQAGLGMPDRGYFLDSNFADKKAAYRAYVAHQLSLVGWADPQASAAAIVELETRIARASWTMVERRDDVKSYNPMSPAELEQAAPGFPWAAYLSAAGLGSVDRLIVDEKTAVFRIAAIFADTPTPTLQAWLAFTLADQSSPYLSRRFADANFAFRNKELSGQAVQRPRWKRGVAAVNSQMGEAVGRIYVARYFPPQSKARMLALVGDLRLALRHRIERLDWMSPATRKEALAKLSMLRVKIAYPDHWRDYSPLEISDDDLYGDMVRATAFEWRRQVARLDQPVDRGEWGMTPQTVNAYYLPTANEIVFPAAALQPPFFDPDADMAVNYGAIGAGIGHEIIHGFDDQGRRSDGKGELRDWWTAEDAARFDARARAYGEEFAAIDFPDAPGMHIDPQQTMGENIADLGGLVMALDAYHASLHGRPAPVMDGLTGDQRLFLGWAQVWRARYRADALKCQLSSNPHSPNPVDAEVFARANSMLDDKAIRHGQPSRIVTASPLTGRLFTADGDRMSPAFGNGRGGKRYRYYVASEVQKGARAADQSRQIDRVSADAIEDTVRARLRPVLADLGAKNDSWEEVLAVLERVQIGSDFLTIELKEARIKHGLARTKIEAGAAAGERVEVEGDRLVLTMTIRMKMRGGRTSLTDPGATTLSKVRIDRTLVMALRSAHAMQKGLHEQAPNSAYRVAICRLAFLAPDIQQAIMSGRQPANLTLQSLIENAPPLAWADQRKQLGFSAVDGR